MAQPKASVLASYGNPQKHKARVIRVSDTEVAVEIGNRTLTYRGVYAQYQVGDMVEIPLKCNSWSMVTKWSPFDEPSPYDVDDE